MDDFDLKLKFALSERELELLKVQVSDLIKYKKSMSDTVTETKHALSHLTIALQTYKDLMAEKLVQQGTINSEARAKQMELNLQLTELANSYRALLSRIEALVDRIDDLEQAQTTTTTAPNPPPGSRSLDFSEGGSGLLFLRIVLGIILGIAAILSGDAGLDVMLGLIGKIFGGS